MSVFRLAFLMFALLVSGFAQASYSFDPASRASDEELDRMRGGFIVNLNGLEFLMAFSLERLTFINGELVSSVRLNPFAMTPLSQLGQAADGTASGASGASVPAQVPVVTNDAPVQVPSGGIAQPGGADNTTVAIVADQPASEALTAASTLPSGQAASGTETLAVSPPAGTLPAQSVEAAAIKTPAANLQVATQGTLTVIQNGPGNTFTLPANISADALTTVIQNTLNDQVIRNVTTMNLTIASQALAAQARLNAILDQGFNMLR